MQTINFIIRNNNDEDGLTEEIIHEIKNKYVIDVGIVYDSNYGARAEENGIIYYPMHIIYRHDCVELHDPLPALDGDVLEAMLPYKSMALDIMMRESDYDVYDISYLEKVYYKHLKYWYNILASNNINTIIFTVVPHLCGEYILYALAKTMDIKTLIMYPQFSVEGLFFNFGYSIESIGCFVEKKYRELGDAQIVNKDLHPFMKKAIESVDNNHVMGATKTNEIKKFMNYRKRMYSSVKTILESYFHIFKIKLGIEKRKYKKDSIESYRRRINLGLRIRKISKKIISIDEYDKIADSPRNGEVYIYFPLQVTPECSTMPLAGEFKNQLLSIEMLAEVAKEYNIFIYVKEHWSQMCRDKSFYEKLTNIPGVRLIKSSINSLQLIDNSFCVASQTGNCLFEAMIKNKFAIALGSGNPLKGAPNIITVKTKKDALEAIARISNHGEILHGEVMKYCYAMQNTMAFMYLDSVSEASQYYDKKVTAKKIVHYLEEI